jgi:hypothetical protein
LNLVYSGDVTHISLPAYTTVKKTADEVLAHSLHGLIPITLTDEQGHTAQHFVSPEEHEYYELLNQYKMALETYSLHFLEIIFLEAFQKKKLSYEILIEYLKNKSWIGKTFAKEVENKPISFNWLNRLAPSIFEYFVQIEFSIASRKYPNLVLCIDSLALKIEGLLRDLLAFSGVSTFYSDKDTEGRTIYREKDLNSLLHEEKINDLLNRDDLLFFKFVLVEKVGYNLRHRIAHSLMLEVEYQIKYAELLLLLLLKLGRYDVKPIAKEDKKENTVAV